MNDADTEILVLTLGRAAMRDARQQFVPPSRYPLYAVSYLVHDLGMPEDIARRCVDAAITES